MDFNDQADEQLLNDVESKISLILLHNPNEYKMLRDTLEFFLEQIRFTKHLLNLRTEHKETKFKPLLTEDENKMLKDFQRIGEEIKKLDRKSQASGEKDDNS